LVQKVVHEEEIKSTLRAIVCDGFCLESLRNSYSFYKVHPSTLPFRPAKAVPYLSRKYSQQQKRVTRKCRSLLKFLTAQKGLF
jgi:hypothetical protein